MSKSALRKDKTCLNCRHVVESRYCPNCGQENTDSRKTFHHLFIHFFEDLTHYENAFWRTIRNLLFKPAALTKEYLSGKRLSYLAPVRLYIFISFLTFFLFTVVPDSEDHLLKGNQTATVKTVGKDGKEKDSVISMKELTVKEMAMMVDSVTAIQDSVKSEIHNNYAVYDKDGNDVINFGYDSVRQLDSIQKFAPPSERLSDFEYWISKKFITVKSNNTKQEMWEKFKESFVHNLPKVLFIYMPLFAFFLWLFHNKKRWYYFDHGIFTLHYFSFLLLVALLLFLVDLLLNWEGDHWLLDTLNAVIHFVGFVWMFYYFFPAHHRFYGESRAVSFVKSIALFWINFILLMIIMSLFVIYTFINIH